MDKTIDTIVDDLSMFLSLFDRIVPGRLFHRIGDIKDAHVRRLILDISSVYIDQTETGNGVMAQWKHGTKQGTSFYTSMPKLTLAITKFVTHQFGSSDVNDIRDVLIGSGTVSETIRGAARIVKTAAILEMELWKKVSLRDLNREMFYAIEILSRVFSQTVVPSSDDEHRLFPDENRHISGESDYGTVEYNFVRFDTDHDPMRFVSEPKIEMRVANIFDADQEEATKILNPLLTNLSHVSYQSRVDSFVNSSVAKYCTPEFGSRFDAFLKSQHKNLEETDARTDKLLKRTDFLKTAKEEGCVILPGCVPRESHVDTIDQLTRRFEQGEGLSRELEARLRLFNITQVTNSIRAGWSALVFKLYMFKDNQYVDQISAAFNEPEHLGFIS